MHNIRRHHNFVLFFAAVVCATFAAFVLLPADSLGAAKPSPATAAKTQAAGRLIVKRSANLGLTGVGISVDGKQVAKLNFNGSYDAPIAAGQHTITALPIPNHEHADPTNVRLTVQPGKTYTFTAYRNDVRIALK